MKEKQLKTKRTNTNKTAHSVFSGLNAQVLAAFSLFLQYLTNPKFSYIHLEAKNFQDFNLVFSDGRKIICEVKDRKKAFSYANLKEVLDLLQQEDKVEKNDEILLVCRKISKTFLKKIENAQYFKSAQQKLIDQHGFTHKHMKIIGQVKFWRAEQGKNKEIILSLFSDIIDCWLPQGSLDELVDALLIKIFNESAEGGIFSREQLLSIIRKKKQTLISNSGVLDRERKSIREIIKNLNIAVDDPEDSIWAPNQLASLSAQSDLFFYVLRTVEDKKFSDLSKWDDFWLLSAAPHFSVVFLKIFEHNLDVHKNREYVLNLLDKTIDGIKSLYRRDYFEYGIIRLLSAIVDKDKQLVNRVFHIIEKLLSQRDNVFYMKFSDAHDSSAFYEREQTVKLLIKIFDCTNQDLQNKIYQFVIKYFNLIRDEDTYSHYTPQDVFVLLRGWLLVDLERRLVKLKNDIVRQLDCDRLIRGKESKFDGWERFGGMSSGWNHEVTIKDRHFLVYCIIPAITQYYAESQDTEDAWSFLKLYCKTEEEMISREYPDFMSRSMIDVLIKRAQSQNQKISDEAINILEKFICMRDGIPFKADLIYQAISKNKVISDKIKWKLLTVGLKEHSQPNNVFMEEILSELAWCGFKLAKDELKKRAGSEAYYKRKRFSCDIRIIKTIQEGLDHDFEFAVELFIAYIETNYFIEGRDDCSPYEAADVLYNIIIRDFETGRAILSSCAVMNELTRHQQILFSYALFNNNYIKNLSNEVDLLLKVYNEILTPDLLNQSESNDIINRFSFAEARKGFIEFADRLALNYRISEALSIVSIFISDPDPVDEFESIQQGKDPSIITSVRGRCAWALMNCANLQGREYLNDIIEFTQKLTLDKNNYIRHMACFPLAQLVRNRLTVMPEEKTTLFFDDDKLNALKKSKWVEKIAFDLLISISKSPLNIKKALSKSIVRVFHNLCSLNAADAWKLVNTIVSKFPDKTISEAASLFIYFAEFRKNNFKNWTWKLPGLYDDLSPSKFDSAPFKEELIKIISKLSPSDRFNFAAYFERLIFEDPPGTDEAEHKFELSYYYLNDHLSVHYSESLFNCIYITIKTGMERNWHFQEWLDLYLKCLTCERQFYLQLSDVEQKSARIRTSFYHADIFLLIGAQGGREVAFSILELIKDLPYVITGFSFRGALKLFFLENAIDQRVKSMQEKSIDKLGFNFI